MSIFVKAIALPKIRSMWGEKRALLATKTLRHATWGGVPTLHVLTRNVDIIEKLEKMFLEAEEKWETQEGKTLGDRILNAINTGTCQRSDVERKLLKGKVDQRLKSV
jgi:hypothetical protein